MPCCIGAVLRRRLAVAIGARPPPFAAACLKNHCLFAPCSICQEAKIVQKKQHGLDHKAAVARADGAGRRDDTKGLTEHELQYDRAAIGHRVSQRELRVDGGHFAQRIRRQLGAAGERAHRWSELVERARQALWRQKARGG